MQLDRIMDLFDAEIVSFQPTEPKNILKFSEPGFPLDHGLLINCGTTEEAGAFMSSSHRLKKPSGGVRKTFLDMLGCVG